MPAQDRSPAFQFYAQDWLADPKVGMLTLAQQGAYIRILAMMWAYSDAGCELPIAIALKTVGKRNLDPLINGRESVLMTHTDRDGIEFAFSNRLFAEAQKHRTRRDQCSEAGKRSAEARARKKEEGNER